MADLRPMFAAARAVGVGHGRLRRWEARGLLKPAGHEVRGGVRLRLYDLADVRRLLAAYPRWTGPKTRPPSRVGERAAKALPPRPCRYPPGHPRKVRAMQLRAAAGYRIFHPDDAGFEAWNTYREGGA